MSHRVSQLLSICILALQLALAPMAQAGAAAYGDSFGDAFKGSFINSVVALGLADAQTGIGDVFANGANGGEGSLGHVLLHGLAGCVAAEAQGADCAAGAAGGIAGAVYSGLQKAPERGSYTSDAAYQATFASWKTDVLAKGELFSLTAAYVFSGGKAENVGAANLVSNSAIANNYLTHAQFDALESELRACGTNAECNRQVVLRYTEISAEQQHELAMCGTDIACMAPHLQAIAEARNHPLRAAMLASRGVRSSALQEFEYQVEVAYLGHTESMFDTGLFEGIYTPNYSRYFEYPQWAASNCSGLAASACMAGFQQQLKSDLYLQGMGSGAQAFAISAGVGSIAVAPSAALALRQCAANPVCFSNLNLDLTVALGELTGATAGQMAFTVRVGGAIAGKLVLAHGDEIVSVIDDLGRVLRPVSQTPDDLGRFLVTTTDGVTGYLGKGGFVTVPNKVAPSFSTPQLQHEFKHAGDFGVTGNWNATNGALFQSAINQHISDPATLAIAGTYRGQPATHFFNPQTGNNVFLRSDGSFWGAWRLGPAQISNLTSHGGLN